MENIPEETESREAGIRISADSGQSGSGCLSAGLLIVMIVWLILATVVSQTISWAIEQTLFQGTLNIPDLRWAVALGYGLVILLPSLIIWYVGRRLPNRRFYGSIALLGGLALFLVPARLAGITSSLGTDALLIAGLFLFWLFVGWFQRRRKAVRGTWQGWELALLISGALSFPWVLWGALGSIWDILLSLLTALLFGAVIVQIIRGIFTEDRPAALSAILLEGLMVALVLVAGTTGLGVNGNQGLLVISVPVMGWALAILYRRWQPAEDRSRDNGRALALLAGLAAFWPMAFIDPDELSVVISIGPGELIQWANQAAFVTFGIGILAVLILIAARNQVYRGGRAFSIGAMGVIWVAVLGLYFGMGQPGLYGERLFAILKDQADVTSAANIQDYNQRRAAVYQTLVQKADSTQAGIRGTLNRFRIPYQPYYLENAIEVQGGPLVRWWLESRPEVDRVLRNPILRPLPEPLPQEHGPDGAPADVPWNLKMIGADRVWNELGVTGKGILVGQSDSGVQGTHPELANSYRGKDGQDNYNWFDPWYHTTAPTDIGGHGTHTLGTVLGKSVGVAPGAEWIGCVNLARNLGNPSLYLDCMQFMLAPFPQNGDPLHAGRPELGAMVLNNSWGCPTVEGCDPDALLPAVKALRAAGIFVVASAGNDGQGGCGSVKDPLALYAQVYSVGAVGQGGGLASFSSLGPVEVDKSQRLKPDITAPGEAVLSAFPGNTYDILSGTSMAGPHVVGVVALMWAANPALIGNIDRTTQILDQTATPYTGSLPQCVRPGDPNDGAGYGIVNAYEAVRMAMGK